MQTLKPVEEQYSILKPVNEPCRDRMNTMKTERKGKAS